MARVKSEVSPLRDDKEIGNGYKLSGDGRCEDMQTLFHQDEDASIGGLTISRAEWNVIVEKGYVRFVVAYCRKSWGARIGIALGIGSVWGVFGRVNDRATMSIGLALSAVYLIGTFVSANSTWFRLKRVFAD